MRRETVARHDPRRQPKPAKVITGSQAAEAKPAKVITGGRSAAEPYREVVEAAVAKGLTAQRIWQDLREQYGYGQAYSSVLRFVRTIKRRRPEVADVLEHPPGQEAQVDFFQGPPTLETSTANWRRPWNFRMTLACSRHGYEGFMYRIQPRHDPP